MAEEVNIRIRAVLREKGPDLALLARVLERQAIAETNQANAGSVALPPSGPEEVAP